jgi:hypothetical protein
MGARMSELWLTAIAIAWYAVNRHKIILETKRLEWEIRKWGEEHGKIN